MCGGVGRYVLWWSRMMCVCVWGGGGRMVGGRGGGVN